MIGLTVAGLARAGGVGVETVRYYQRRELLPMPAGGRTGDGESGGVRRYGAEDVRRLRFIRAAQGAGFTLAQIAKLLALGEGDDRVGIRAMAAERVAALDGEIAALRGAREALHRLAAQCDATAAASPCPIITAFEGGGSEPDGKSS